MNWDEIYSGIKVFANRAATKINQSADIATLQVKLSMAERKLEETFAILGKAAYTHFTEDQDNSEKVAACIGAVQNVKMEIRALQEQIADAKRRAGMDNGRSATDESPKEQAESTEASSPTSDKAEERDEPTVSADPALAPVAVTGEVQAPAPTPITAVSDSEDAVEITVETVE